MKKIVIALVTLVIMVAIVSPVDAAKFKDVSNEHSLQIEIEYLADRGVIGGYSDGTFKPTAPIAKKHIAAMLVKALNLSTTNSTNPGYADVPVTHPYYKEIAAAYTAGIFGKATNFKPESSISRAFMAKILATSFNLKSIANNAVTYEDVKKTNEFYSPIQLVTMNSIATGYRTADYDLYFKPNDLLTRAHFSAFLARAMSLRTGNYTPNTSYTYFYEDIDGKESKLVYDYTETDSGVTSTYWKLYDAVGDFVEGTVYMNGSDTWVEGLQESDVGTFLKYPFTVGTKYNTLYDNEIMQEKQSIISTNEEVRLAGQRYNDVVVIESTYPGYNTNGQPIGFTTSKLYIAKDYGIIGAKDSRDYWVSWLTKREPR